MTFPNPRLVPGSIGPGLSMVGDPYYFEDFITGGDGVLFSGSDDVSMWNIDDIAGTAVNTIADAENGGVLSMDSGATTTTHGANAQHTGQAWSIQAGKDLVFECRFKVSTATTTDFLIGMCSTDVTAIAGVADGIVFRSGAVDVAPTGAGTADIICTVGESMAGSWTASTVTDVDSGVDIVADTFVVVAFHVTGTDRVRMYVNGSEKLNTTLNIPSAATFLVPTLAFQNFGTGRRIMEVDYVFIAQVR